MTYLIWQILVCLLVAFLLGLLLGWWLGRRKLHDSLERLEAKWRLKMERRREELTACQAELEACREDLETAGEERSIPGDDLAAAPVPLLDVEEGEEEAGAGVDSDAAEEAEPDDLKKVEGIGPKIEGLLNARGIATWAQLAAAEVSFLQSVLDDAGPRYRVHDPSTWPRQAALAADGAWDELEALQDQLKGGRER